MTRKHRIYGVLLLLLLYCLSAVPAMATESGADEQPGVSFLTPPVAIEPGTPSGIQVHFTAPGFVTVELLDEGGEPIATVIRGEEVMAGEWWVNWLGEMPDGQALAPGNYILQVQLRDQAGNVSKAARQAFTVVRPASGVNVEVIIICIIAGVFVAFMFIYRRRQEGRLALEEKKQAQKLQEELAAIRAQNEAAVARTYEEIKSGLTGFNDSIVRMASEVTRTQQSQLDSFGGQLRAVNRVEEDRLEKISDTVERQLHTYEQRLLHLTQVMDGKLENSEQRLERIRLTLETGLAQVREDHTRRLAEISAGMDDKLHTTLDKRLGESFQLVNEQLEKVAKGLGEMQSLATGVGDLKRLFTHVNTRGAWGEVQLSALLEQILAPGQYEANVQLSPAQETRASFAVALPGKGEGERPVYLPIDAKFPMEAYQRLLDAAEKGRRVDLEAAGKALAQALRERAQVLHQTHLLPPFTTDYAVLFLPIEGLYAEALRSGALVEELQQQYHVVIAGPTTLAALLNSLQMGFRTLAIERRTGEVWTLLSVVKTEFARFSELLSRTQQKLQQASDSIEDAARKTRTIEQKLRGVTEGEGGYAPKPLPQAGQQASQAAESASPGESAPPPTPEPVEAASEPPVAKPEPAMPSKPAANKPEAAALKPQDEEPVPATVTPAPSEPKTVKSAVKAPSKAPDEPSIPRPDAATEAFKRKPVAEEDEDDLFDYWA